MKNDYLTLVSTAALILCDQAMKYLCITGYLNGIDWGIIQFTRAYNQGVMLSWFQELPYAILIILQVILITACYRYRHLLPKISQRLFFAGAISNLIDRILHTAVIDYLQLSLFHWHWPAIINLADIYITAAIGIYLYVDYHNKQPLKAQ